MRIETNFLLLSSMVNLSIINILPKSVAVAQSRNVGVI